MGASILQHTCGKALREHQQQEEEAKEEEEDYPLASNLRIDRVTIDGSQGKDIEDEDLLMNHRDGPSGEWTLRMHMGYGTGHCQVVSDV